MFRKILMGTLRQFHATRTRVSRGQAAVSLRRSHAACQQSTDAAPLVFSAHILFLMASPCTDNGNNNGNTEILGSSTALGSSTLTLSPTPTPTPSASALAADALTGNSLTLPGVGAPSLRSAVKPFC